MTLFIFREKILNKRLKDFVSMVKLAPMAMIAKSHYALLKSSKIKKIKIDWITPDNQNKMQKCFGMTNKARSAKMKLLESFLSVIFDSNCYSVVSQVALVSNFKTFVLQLDIQVNKLQRTSLQAAAQIASYMDDY
ncbi:CLUMA_CG001668, isoform A [Clunio marinus]|uniref:CLUMA_CG001668, isoform A n=1 Tax=Clunio marinus TaxID=568069 RepID=A0A1J1HNS6_9DIPT|nr:CLUMA_CG001668, isoform A [Clunio marinus]